MVEAPAPLVRRSAPPGTARVEIDKVADVFTIETAQDLAPLCTPGGRPLPRLPVTERLTTNLMRVQAFAPSIYSATTPCRERNDAWERMRSNGSFESGFYPTGGRIFSLGSLDEGPLSVLCDGPVSAEPTES